MSSASDQLDEINMAFEAMEQFCREKLVSLHLTPEQVEYYMGGLKDTLSDARHELAHHLEMTVEEEEYAEGARERRQQLSDYHASVL